jgi:hypothetical protein
MELNLEDKIRFGIPFYFGRSWICYLNPIKNHKVELAFVRGNELSNIQKVILLDETTSYESKRKSGKK